MPSYCTLQGARRQLDVQKATRDVDQDTDLFFYMLTAAVSIDDWTGMWFDERLLTLGFSSAVGKYSPLLYLKELPLQVINSLTNGNSDVIAAANYTPLPTGAYPKTQVRLAQGYYWRGPSDPAGATDACYVTGRMLDAAYAEDAIQIAGLWVYHRNYPRAWKRLSQVVAAGGIDDSSATLNISAQAGTAFDVGDILRVTTGAATEQMLVTGPIVSSTRTGFATAAITVERGYNSTTPIVHTAGAVLDLWVPEPMIRNIAEMATAALYKGRGNPTGDTQVVAEFGNMVIPVDLPAKIKSFLVPYRSWRRGRP